MVGISGLLRTAVALWRRGLELTLAVQATDNGHRDNLFLGRSPGTDAAGTDHN